MSACITSSCDGMMRWWQEERLAPRPRLCLVHEHLRHGLRRSQRGRHSTKYTEEMEDKELLADEEGGKDVRCVPLLAGCCCVQNELASASQG